MIYICNFHVVSHLLLIYICKLQWKWTGFEGELPSEETVKRIFHFKVPARLILTSPFR